MVRSWLLVNCYHVLLFLCESRWWRLQRICRTVSQSKRTDFTTKLSSERYHTNKTFLNFQSKNSGKSTSIGSSENNYFNTIRFVLFQLLPLANHPASYSSHLNQAFEVNMKNPAPDKQLCTRVWLENGDILGR